MIRRFVMCAPTTVLAMMVAQPVAAGGVNILQNAGFETGGFDPWYLDKDFGAEEAWSVTNADAHSGRFAATNIGNSSLRQDFAPVATEDILEVSIWIRQPEEFINAIDFFYSDGSWEEFVIEPVNDWKFFNVTGQLDAGKELTSFRVWGFFLGGGEVDRTYIDDVRVIIKGDACPWDLDGDDNVGTTDLIAMLGTWGDPYGTADLIELLGAWGPCPK